MEKYLDGQELTIDEIKASIRKQVLDCALFPVFCGSAYKNKGIQLLLDAVLDYLRPRWTSRRLKAQASTENQMNAR